MVLVCFNHLMSKCDGYMLSYCCSMIHVVCFDKSSVLLFNKISSGLSNSEVIESLLSDKALSRTELIYILVNFIPWI